MQNTAVCIPYQARHLGVRTKSPHAKTGEGGREESILRGVTNQSVSPCVPQETGASGVPRLFVVHTMLNRKPAWNSRTHASSRLSCYIIPSLLGSDVVKSLAPPWRVTSGCLEPLRATIIFINRPVNAHRHTCRNRGRQCKKHSSLCTQSAGY